jgi:hypothetical protein
LSYGKTFTFQRWFFEQFDELMKEVPRVALWQRNADNAKYTNDSENSKNCYMCFTSWENENCLYVNNGFWSKNSVDCFWINTCERCYNSIQLSNCYKLFDSFSCFDCSESRYLYECKNVNHSAFCINLTNKSYNFLNKQYTKLEYEHLLEKLQNDITFRNECILEYHKLVSTIPTNQLRMDIVENCFWNNIANSKNCYAVYDSTFIEESKYIYQWGRLFTSMDSTITGSNEERGYVYETLSTPGSNRCFFSSTIGESNAVFFSDFCYYSENLFGCVWLRHKEYCILNKQYTKEEYEKLVAKIIEHMQKTWEWWEFFPPSLSPFGYNETIANEYLPVKKSDLPTQHGYKWSNYSTDPKLPENAELLHTATIPEEERKALVNDDSILKKVIICKESQRPFTIQKLELAFYRKMDLPLPKFHPDIRHEKRMKQRPWRTLYLRTCDKCGKEMVSIYPVEDTRSVYCEACYRQEIYG